MPVRSLQFEVLEPRNLLALVAQVPPFLEDFSAGLPAEGQGWEFTSMQNGVIDVTNGVLAMSDSRADSVNSLNEAVLHLDLSGVVSADLRLDHVGQADEIHKLVANTFSGHANADLIALSVNGQHWVKLTDLAENFTARTLALDSALELAATLAGTADRSNVRIKFQQYDNGPAPGDGRQFDNISVAVVQRPLLKIEGNGQPILAGTKTASAAGGTLFPGVNTQGMFVQEFTLRNAGAADLRLSPSAPLTISGKHAGDFLLMSQPDIDLAPGESTTFAVAFAPVGTGNRVATINIASNDASHPVFSFNISGTGLKTPVGPLATAALVAGEATPQAITRTVPYVQRFDAGLPGLAEGWEFRSSRDGRIDLLDGQLRFFDTRHDANYSLNEAILHVDLSGITSAELTFDHVGRLDDRQGFSRTSFVGSVNADLISLSIDGVNWAKVTALTGDLIAKVFLLDNALQLAKTLSGTTNVSNVRIKFQQYDNSSYPTDGRLIDNVRVSAVLRPITTVEGNGLVIATGAKAALATNGTLFGSAPAFQSVVRTFTIRNSGADPLFLTGATLAVVSGNHAADFRIVEPPAAVVNPGESTTFTIAFSPIAMGVRTAQVSIATNDRAKPNYTFTISGTGIGTPEVLNAAPAAGRRVRVVAPEYAHTQVYHTVYLPTNWEPDRLYPVIVEYAPNQWGPSGSKGTVEDTQLGYYLSQGQDFIWVTMPFIKFSGGTYVNATTWWGSGFNDAGGLAITASYTRTNLVRVLEQFGGDPSRVLVTGFSRGAIATSSVALFDPQIADLWTAFIPHSHHDLDTTRLSRVAGRASFITYGSNDGGAQNSRPAANFLRAMGFPVVERTLPGLGHTDSWVQDDASATSQAVRAELRSWIDQVLELRPGTHAIRGVVTDSQGNPLSGVRIQSGESHFTFTDAAGQYELAGLINSQRTISALFDNRVISFAATVSNADVNGRDFVFT